MIAVDRATDPQPVVRPVPRSRRAVATYVLEMKDRESIRNAPSQGGSGGKKVKAFHRLATSFIYHGVPN